MGLGVQAEAVEVHSPTVVQPPLQTLRVSKSHRFPARVGGAKGCTPCLGFQEESLGKEQVPLKVCVSAFVAVPLFKMD